MFLSIKAVIPLRSQYPYLILYKILRQYMGIICLFGVQRYNFFPK